MKLKTVSVRAPSAWQGRVGSEAVRRWMAEYFGSPRSLPSDPGPGEGFLRLSLPARAVKALEAATGDPASVALRRLVASRLALPAASARPLMSSLPAETRSCSVAASSVQASSLSVGVLSGQVQASATGRPARRELLACLRCNSMTWHYQSGVDGILGRWNCEVCEARDRSYRAALERGCLDAGQLRGSRPVLEPRASQGGAVTPAAVPSSNRGQGSQLWLWLLAGGVAWGFIELIKWLGRGPVAGAVMAGTVARALRFAEWVPRL